MWLVYMWKQMAIYIQIVGCVKKAGLQYRNQNDIDVNGNFSLEKKRHPEIVTTSERKYPVSCLPHIK